MRLTRVTRRTLLLAAFASAVAMASVGAHVYRPWEAHYRGRPTSWWAREIVARPLCVDPGPSQIESWLDGALAPLGLRWSTDNPEEALVKSGPEALPVLIALLRAPNYRVRCVAAYALLQKGQGARQAVPALLEAWRQHANASRTLARYAHGPVELSGGDEDEVVAVSVGDALMEIDPEAAERAGIR